MMEEIIIRPNSLATLALSMMSGVPTLYLLGLRKKSRDGWLVLGLYGVLTLFFVSSFIKDITLDTPLNPYIAKWPIFHLSLVAIYLCWFSYSYRQLHFRREMYIVLTLETIVAIIGLIFPFSPPLVYPIGLIGCSWSSLVLMRKSWLSDKSENKMGKSNLGEWSTRIKPTLRQESKAYRAFAGWYFYFFLLSINFNLMVYRVLPFNSIWEIIHNILFLTLVTWLLFNYLNYANESTTFLVKLIGLFLCSTLIILGLLGFLLFRLGSDYSLIQRELWIVALMIVGATLFIVTIFPMLFRNNLLLPLQKVVEGIKRVNAGDLQANVSVSVQDEIGYLAASFNQMIESLRHYSNDMESLVSQRTAQLQQQKEELLSTLEQLRITQEKLKRLDVQKTRFFDNITHEFRTPLTLILAPAQQLLSILEKNSLPYSYLQSIERNAGHLLRLINQLLDLSRMELNGLPLKKSRGNMVAFTGQIAEAFAPAAEQKRIRLTCLLDDRGDEQLFDSDKWEKIVSNLLANALKFTSSQGEIKVMCRIVEPDALLLQIADTGIGIPAEKLPYIFDRFYQADDSRTRAYDGSGIGLALVKEFTGLLGGSIDVESKEGEGTIFTLKLPLTWATGTEQILPAIKSTANFSILEKLVPEDKKETKPLLLLVEDNQEMLHFLSQALADTYRVLRATNGREGLEIARKELPEVVISDVMMPKMDGYAFCQALKTDPYTDHIAVLLLTARTSQDSRMEGLSLGADDYIAKPFHLEELRLRLHNLLDRQAKLREYYCKQWNTLEATISLPGAKDAFTEKLYSLIEANLDNPALNPEILASEVAMSVRTLNRKLHTVMGIPAAKLIRVYRLKRAATLLKSGQSVSDTAYQIGFESPSYFATAFKEYYQKTPSEYVAC